MVKCKDCGYLVVRNRLTRGLDEAEQSYRDTGEVREVPRTRPFNPGVQPSAFESYEKLQERWPICFENAFPLRPLAYAKGKARGPDHTDLNYTVEWFITPEDIRETISEDRICPRYTQWHQGSSPKEHQEMTDRRRLIEFQTKREDDWQKFQAQMAADDKRWREERVTEDRKWREEQEAKAEERHLQEIGTLRRIHRGQMWIMGGVVTVAIVVATLLGAGFGGAIQAGWFPKWFGIG